MVFDILVKGYSALLERGPFHMRKRMRRRPDSVKNRTIKWQNVCGLSGAFVPGVFGSILLFMALNK